MSPRAAGAAPVRVAIFGATSAIAEHVARRYAQAGARLVLIARRPHVVAIARDLEIRGAAEVVTRTLDLDDDAAPETAAADAFAAFGGVDVALLAYGTLPDQGELEGAPARARAALGINLVSPATLLLALAPRFEAQGRGVIAVITSVAGVRGRASNFVYGAAKAGLSTLLEGLRQRLAGTGVQVLDIRPGFVATPMTAHLDRRGPLWAPPARVAGDIQRAIDRRRAILYTPWFWRWIMLIIRLLPRPLFHQLRI